MPETGRSALEWSIPEDVPTRRCGFTVEYRDQSQLPGSVTCWRESWTNSKDGLCVWHANIKGKKVAHLAPAKSDTWERLDGAMLREANLKDAISFSGCKLLGAECSEADLQHALLANADLRYAVFTEAELAWTNLIDACLIGGDFTDADLQNATLTDANLRDITLNDTDLMDADLNSTKLAWADLTNADLTGADLQDANLLKADLSNASLVSADLTNAYVQNAVLTGASLYCADLIDISLQNADINNANLRGANLTKASLRSADLTDADLQRAPEIFTLNPNINVTNLTNAVLSRANLTNASLWDAKLTNATLKDTDLTNSNFQEADLTNANLFEANLKNADLEEANLTDSDLENAVLEDSRLTNTNLTGATLERSNCTRADFFDADLTDAELYGAVLSDVQLNTGTKFGDHYPEDVDKAVWTLAQIEELSRRNALLGQVREAFTTREDRRRRHYWRTSVGPWFARQVNVTGRNLINRFRANIRTVLPGDQAGVDATTDDSAADKSAASDDPPESGANGGVSENSGGDNPRTTSQRWNAFRSCWLNTGRWAWLALTGATTRYGESPRRVVATSLAVILGFGLVYPFVGGIETTTAETEAFKLAEWLSLPVGDGTARIVFENLYFSAVTFTTLGYGDIQPGSDTTKLLASIESLLGALLMALLVAVLARRITR